MRRMVLLILFVASSSRCGAQTAAQPKKHLLVLGEEKGYRHEAVSHAILPSSASAGKRDCGPRQSVQIPKR